MAAWRFGCEDCNWEWSLVTLGIVAAVLAVLVLLAICAAASDDNGGLAGGCCCLLLLFIILIGVGFGLGLHSSEPPYQQPKSMTIYNQQCWSHCSQKGATYYWCWTSALNWNYCSEDPSHTRYGQECSSRCASKEESYFWCHKTGGGWDYCSPNHHKDSAMEQAPSTDDVTIYNEKCDTKCNTLLTSYFWCWTSTRQVSWDYCSEDNGHTRYGQECSDGCAKRKEKFFWCHLKTGSWDYCSPKKLTGVALQGGSGAHEGNVYLDGRPVCHDSWDDTDAAVVCRSLGFTGGQATKRSRFGRVPDNFIMDDVKCSGRELRLEDCRHNSRDNCGTVEGAGVVCLTTTRPEERNKSSLADKQMEPYSRLKVGWLTMGVMTSVVSLVLLTLMTHKLCSSSSSRRKSTFQILLLLLALLLILAGLGFGLALRPRKSTDVEWWVWMVVAVDGVLLAMCTGLLMEKQRNKRRLGNKEATEGRELADLPGSHESGGLNDSYVPETPSAPTMSNHEAEGVPPMNELIQLLLNSVLDRIKKKEAGLECPVCLETAQVPIYSCSSQHLICSECRSKVEICPECRNPYDDWERHRYAEKNREELEELYLEKKTVELSF